MILSTLFPETSSPASSEPPVWFRRLVILESIDPEPIVIRELPLGLGLNIICTRPPPEGSTEALGHDVGKTLLTRLLRYCLGEETYAEGRTRSAVRRAFFDSYVAAEIRVAGQDWCVLRHIRRRHRIHRVRFHRHPGVMYWPHRQRDRATSSSSPRCQTPRCNRSSHRCSRTRSVPYAGWICWLGSLATRNVGTHIRWSGGTAMPNPKTTRCTWRMPRQSCAA